MPFIDDMTPSPSTKTVVVLGASYGGCRASRLLSQSLPAGWRVVVIDRNSHMNHVYVFPRFVVLPTHAPKAFIPYNNILAHPLSKLPTHFSPPTPPLSRSSTSTSLDTNDESHQVIQASVISLSRNTVTFIRPAHARDLSGSFPGLATTGSNGTFDGPEESIHFDYLLYALGSGMPDPVNVWREHPNMPREITHDCHERGLGTKKGAVRWMEMKSEQLKGAKRICIVGGGALGIQFATDLKDIYPDKKITLLHSRTRFMPIYPIEMHDAIVDGLEKLNVEVIMGERVTTWPDDPEVPDGNTKLVITDKGRRVEVDLVLPCTGQKPHSSFIASLAPSAISPKTSRIRVLPSMQINTSTSPSIAFASLSLQTPQTSLPTPPSSAGSSSSQAEPEANEDDFSHIFAIGDCADTGSIQAGHTAYYQGEVAARNIVRLIQQVEGGDKEERKLESYKAGPPAIKVSLGLTRAVVANGEGVTITEDGVEDLKVMVMWPSLQAERMDVNA